MPEEETFHFGEGKHPDDLGATLGKQVMCCVPETLFDDVPPPNAMEERRVGTALNEPVPARLIGNSEGAHADRGRCRRTNVLQGRDRIHAIVIPTT